MTETWELPEGWVWAEFREVAEIASDLVSPSDYLHSPHIAPNHIESGSGRLLEYTTIAADKVTSPKHRFRPGQILYSKIRPYLCKAALVDFAGLCSADMYPIAAKIDAKYLHSWIISTTFTEWVSGAQGRTVLPKINQEALSVIPVPVPPFAEQGRIVAKLEALTARSRAARAVLADAPALLEQFRQSVLSSAFRGHLTADWRAKHSDTESASELLGRISAERRSQWEAKYPKKQYVEPGTLDETDLPEIPEGWCWASVEQLSWIGGGLTKNNAVRSAAPKTVPLVMVAAVRLRHIDPTGVKEIGLLEEDGDCGELLPEDLLIVEGNGSRDHIGRVALWDSSIPEARHQNHLIRVRPIKVAPRFVLEWLASPLGRDLLVAEATTTTGLYNLSLSKIARIAVPLAPIQEQIELVRRVVGLLEFAKQTEIELQAIAADLDTLDQSILAKAFRGELVPQDPTDEPASVLLERLRSGHSEPKTPKAITRGKLSRIVLLLLHHWNNAASREMVDRGMLLMLDDDLRKRLASGGAKLKRKKRGTPTSAPRISFPHLLGAMIDAGFVTAKMKGPVQTLHANTQKAKLAHDTAEPADLARLSETMKVMELIEEKQLDAELAEAFRGQEIAITV